jgi:uncharacterized protein (TIGR02996 family)
MTAPGTRAALEAALADDPDDLSAHMAYADWLSEQADSRLAARGELIRVQLALEDPALDLQRYKELRLREAQLIRVEDEHLLDGELKRQLLAADPRAEWAFVRGWMSRLHVGELPARLGPALAGAACFRLLRELNVDARLGGEGLAVLAGCPYLGNVRSLFVRLGQDAAGLADLLPCLPRLETLRLDGERLLDARAALASALPRLRVLQVTGGRHCPLSTLAANPSLARLEELSLNWCGGEVGALAGSPHLPALRRLTLRASAVGDNGVRAIVDSGLLARLESLDLAGGQVTDAGVRLLAGSPDTARLRELSLAGNRLTEAGIDTLRRLPGVRLAVERQQRPARARRRRRGWEDWE